MVRKQVKLEMNPLLGGPSLHERATTGNPYRDLNISDIDVDPEQPRRVFDQDGLRELADSIKEFGVITPILVSALDGGTYRLIAGERRLRASIIAGMRTIPAIVDRSEPDGTSILPKQLVENLQRQDLSSLERSIAIGQLKERYSWSIREIAAKLGVSKSLVQRSIEILELPDDLQAALAAGQSESKVLLLASVTDRELRKEMLAQLEALSREQLQQELQKALGDGSGGVSHRGTAKSPRAARSLSPDDERLVEEMSRALGVKVRILRSGSRKKAGKVVLEFYGDQDLQEIFRKVVG